MVVMGVWKLGQKGIEKARCPLYSKDEGTASALVKGSDTKKGRSNFGVENSLLLMKT
jgi:hypothetical protein